jgi:hypothetical protein
MHIVKKKFKNLLINPKSYSLDNYHETSSSEFFQVYLVSNLALSQGFIDFPNIYTYFRTCFQQLQPLMFLHMHYFRYKYELCDFSFRLRFYILYSGERFHSHHGPFVVYFVNFIAHKETLANGLVISMGAAVGLLSHNIKIIGEDYDKLYTESYGARVLVGLVKGGKTHTGNKMLRYFVSLKSACTLKLTLKANNNSF